MNSKYYLPQKQFNEKKFTIIRNFISKERAKFLYNYTITVCRSTAHKIDNYPQFYNKDWDGNFQDSQCPDTFSRYGDPVMDTLLLESMSKMELYTGINLYPTYSYWRLYQKGNILKRHRDRKSCDVSATLCLGYDTTNLINQLYNWSIFVEDICDNKNEIEIQLNPGDVVIYRGCDIDHWRNKYEGLNHSQVFLHYNDVKNGYDNVFDTRKILGTPKLQ